MKVTCKGFRPTTNSTLGHGKPQRSERVPSPLCAMVRPGVWLEFHTDGVNSVLIVILKDRSFDSQNRDSLSFCLVRCNRTYG